MIFCMIRTVTVSEAARAFADLINRVRYRNESALLTKGGKPVAKLVPVESARTGAELARLWDALPHLSRSEAMAFDADLTAARREIPGIRDKWA
jgi:prevent-host-death family protein